MRRRDARPRLDAKAPQVEVAQGEVVGSLFHGSSCDLVPPIGLETYRAGCRAAAEVCFGSLVAPEPWLQANLDQLHLEG